MTLALIIAGALIAMRAWQWWRHGSGQLTGGFPFPAAVIAFAVFALLFGLWLWGTQ